MTGTRQPDNRKYDRTQFDAEVMIGFVFETGLDNVLEVPARGVKAKGVDVSEGGIRVRFDRNDSPTDIVKVQFNVQEFKPVDAYAKLVWQQGTTCGFQYIALNNDYRRHIRDYVNAKKREKD